MPLVLDENRRFDEAGQRRLIRYYLAAGVDGVAAAVHTTQFAIRDPKINLFETVLRVAIEEISACRAKTGREILAVAGVCGPTEQAVAEAKLARSLGYDAALLSPGGLNDRSEDYLIERTRQVADVIDVIGFYLQPAVGGRVFSYAYWQAVCAIPGVAAVKCAAFNRYLTIDVARAIAFSGRDVALYTGNDDSIVIDLLTEYRFQDGDACQTRAHPGRPAGALGRLDAHRRADLPQAPRARPGRAPRPGPPHPRRPGHRREQRLLRHGQPLRRLHRRHP